MSPRRLSVSILINIFHLVLALQTETNRPGRDFRMSYCPCSTLEKANHEFSWFCITCSGDTDSRHPCTPTPHSQESLEGLAVLVAIEMCSRDENWNWNCNLLVVTGLANSILLHGNWCTLSLLPQPCPHLCFLRADIPNLSAFTHRLCFPHLPSLLLLSSGLYPADSHISWSVESKQDKIFQLKHYNFLVKLEAYFMPHRQHSYLYNGKCWLVCTSTTLLALTQLQILQSPSVFICKLFHCLSLPLNYFWWNLWSEMHLYWTASSYSRVIVNSEPVLCRREHRVPSQLQLKVIFWISALNVNMPFITA